MTNPQEPVAASAPSTPVSTTPKKKKSATPKGKSTKKITASHPPTATMVQNAIKSLNERGGSSLAAIKKYISSTYKLDAEKLAPFIRKYVKTAVDSGALVRTKGKGAAGSFKIAVKGKSEPRKKTVEKKPVKKETKPKVKKVKTPKKPTVKKVAKPKPEAKKSKAKKSTKPAAAKVPKAVKPKKAKATPKKAPAKKVVKKK